MQPGCYALPNLHKGSLAERTLQPDRHMPAFGLNRDDNRHLARRCADNAGRVRTKTDIRYGCVRHEIGARDGDPTARDSPQRLDANDARSGSRSGHGALVS